LSVIKAMLFLLAFLQIKCQISQTRPFPEALNKISTSGRKALLPEQILGVGSVAYHFFEVVNVGESCLLISTQQLV
jgi:hypothetical protein